MKALWIATTLAVVVAVAPPAGAQETPNSAPNASSTVAVPAAITGAINSPDRPADDKKLDASRKPGETMAFFGIKPGMQVADLFAGGGYTTEVLARIVGPEGKVYSQNSDFIAKSKKGEEAWKARVKEPGLSNIVLVTKPFEADDLLPVAPGSLDAVVMNLNYHDLVWLKVDRDKMNATIFKDLKPGGLYCIVDNSAAAGSGVRDVQTLHRIDQDTEVAEITKAGFKLAGTSDIQRNPKDDRTWNVFKHRGEADHFILKFVKP